MHTKMREGASLPRTTSGDAPLPRPSARRTATILRDIATALAVVDFAVLALRVHDRVDALSGAGDATGGEAMEAGRAGEQAAHDAARLLKWLVFLIPSGLLLARVVRRGVTQVRTLGRAARAQRLVAPHAERSRLIASRAALRPSLHDAAAPNPRPTHSATLPRAPHVRLVAALAEDAGLRLPSRMA